MFEVGMQFQTNRCQDFKVICSFRWWNTDMKLIPDPGCRYRGSMFANRGLCFKNKTLGKRWDLVVWD